MNETAGPLRELLKHQLTASRQQAKTRGHEWDVADALAAVLEALEEAQRYGYVVL